MIQHSVLKNVARMLERRGAISSADTAFEDFRSSYNEVDQSAQIEGFRVKFHMDTVKTMGKIQDILHFIQESMPAKCILVVQDIVSRPFKELISIENVEIFWLDELYHDVVTNLLIPPHRRVSDQEKAQIFQEYSITAKNLPKIDKTDFMVRYMDFKVNDIIEIRRPSITSGVAIAYRVVVNSSWEKLPRFL